jgi:hypothetical protein
MYSGLHILHKNESFERMFDTVYICAYKINAAAAKPFLQYLLYKKDTTLSFPSFKYINGSSLVSETMTLLRFLCKPKNTFTEYLRFSDPLTAEPESTEVDYMYSGYLTMDEDLYLFFDISDETITGENLWLSLIDEIIHCNNICNFQIESVVSTLFLNNNQLLILHDTDGTPIETPTVAYSGQHESLLNFTFVFGVSDIETIGNYSFTDYVHSIKNGGWSKTNMPEIKYGKLITDNEHGRYIKGGIVRFALFLGKNEIITNTELLTSNWSSEFDSIYYNRLGMPVWIVHKLEQQVPLSYHYIDKKSLSATFNANDVYFVL